MTVIVKLMGAEDAPDSDTRHTYKLFTDVLKIEFERSACEAYVWLWFKTHSQVGTVSSDGPGVPERFTLGGNVYIMNNEGKTISSFGSAPIPGVEIEAVPDCNREPPFDKRDPSYVPPAGSEILAQAHADLIRAQIREVDAKVEVLQAQRDESRTHIKVMNASIGDWHNKST